MSERAPSTETSADRSVIRADRLSKTFAGRTVLSEVSLDISQGEIFGYLGPNGAGKTTTTRLLLGLLRPSAGTALVNGHDIGRSLEARRQIGVLLEGNGLYDRLSALDNLSYYARLFEVSDVKGRVAEMLDLVGLSDRKRDSVGTFSQGMRRRLGLARALLHRPTVLFLDEPAAGLDPEAQKLVRDLIATLSSDDRITVFMNTHDLDDVQRICSRVAILCTGRILADETLAEWNARAEATGLVLTLVSESSADEAARALEELPDVSGCTIDGKTITVTSSRDLPTTKVIRLLEAQGIELHEVRRAKRSLEDFYLETTREARTDD